ncbi:MAG TPA: hypothetical protein VK821_08940 [Dehalococcoidia bacterium]|nr:hypothetical protein [Dehalococcoidia bacterium]
MRLCRPRTVFALAAPMALLLALGCSRKPAQNANPTAAQPSATASTATAAAATATPSASATPGDTPVAGASIKVGDWTVVVDRFHAQVSAREGVNIRSSPEVNATNRTGSLAPGATVDVEGRVPQGQEAEPGNGTTWYYVGTAGSMPQFIYGPAGTLTPLTGSATPAASATGAPVTASPSATP